MEIRLLNEIDNPGIIPDDDSWIEFKKYKSGSVTELYYFRDNTDEHYIILSGEICINGNVYGPGTVLSYEAKERRNFLSPRRYISFKI